jgi:transposase-like protein
MKTQISKPARERTRYTEEYKQEALELWRASGRSAAKVAAELGIRPPLLYRSRAPGAAARGGQERAQAAARPGGVGGGEPSFTDGEREAPGAA